jgi:hypothetical protein
MNRRFGMAGGLIGEVLLVGNLQASLEGRAGAESLVSDTVEHQQAGYEIAATTECPRSHTAGAQ